MVRNEDPGPYPIAGTLDLRRHLVEILSESHGFTRPIGYTRSA